MSSTNYELVSFGNRIFVDGVREMYRFSTLTNRVEFTNYVICRRHFSGSLIQMFCADLLYELDGHVPRQLIVYLTTYTRLVRFSLAEGYRPNEIKLTSNAP